MIEINPAMLAEMERGSIVEKRRTDDRDSLAASTWPKIDGDVDLPEAEDEGVTCEA